MRQPIDAPRRSIFKKRDVEFLSDPTHPENSLKVLHCFERQLEASKKEEPKDFVLRSHDFEFVTIIAAVASADPMFLGSTFKQILTLRVSPFGERLPTGILGEKILLPHLTINDAVALATAVKSYRDDEESASSVTALSAGAGAGGGAGAGAGAGGGGGGGGGSGSGGGGDGNPSSKTKNPDATTLGGKARGK